MDSERAQRRPLTALERGIIELLLSVNFDGADALRAQLNDAEVASQWVPEGSPSFNIWLPDTAQKSGFKERLAPVSAPVLAADGGILGEILLWLLDGRLSALEYAWVTDDPPVELPDPDRVKVVRA